MSPGYVPRSTGSRNQRFWCASSNDAAAASPRMGLRFSVIPTGVFTRERSASTASPCEYRSRLCETAIAVGQSRMPGALRPSACPRNAVDPRLVVGDPALDDVAERVGHEPRVLGEAQRRVAHGPAADLLPRLRQVPVVEGRDRLDPALQQPSTSRRYQATPRGFSAPRPSGCTRGQAIEKR